MKKIILIILILIFSILIYLGYQYYIYYNQKKLIKDFINNTDELYNKFNLIERRASTTMRVSL
jgi:putative effector of murein hydrolase